ncbi:MAG: type II toxin-antitoxin system Phd/YefM family antitoxin [Dehalococcoidia bacterium]
METFSMTEARRRLEELADRVALTKEPIAITRWGKKVAMLSPLGDEHTRLSPSDQKPAQ